MVGCGGGPGETAMAFSLGERFLFWRVRAGSVCPWGESGWNVATVRTQQQEGQWLLRALGNNHKPLFANHDHDDSDMRYQHDEQNQVPVCACVVGLQCAIPTEKTLPVRMTSCIPTGSVAAWR